MQFDQTIYLWAQTHRTPGMDAFMLEVSRLFSAHACFFWAVGVGVGLLILDRTWRHSAILILGSAIAYGLSFGLKDVFKRTRPPEGLRVMHSTSFPSAHSLCSAVLFGLVAWILIQKAPKQSAAFRTLAVAGPLLVGCSRIYLGMHWFTDVVGGWTIGAAVVGLWPWLVIQVLERR